MNSSNLSGIDEQVLLTNGLFCYLLTFGAVLAQGIAATITNVQGI